MTDCDAALGDYVQSLRTIDARLDVGLNVGELREPAGQASVGQGQVDDLPEADFCDKARRAADDAAVRLRDDRFWVG